MADVITRLKLESGEYDSKIKRAVTGLQQMENECRKVGGTLAVLEKDQLDYVKSLGQMQTVATSTRGKLNELTQAYTELRVQYNRLTDEEKKGDFGKALSSSLDQLKTRINNTKTELNSVNVELGNTKQAEQGTASGIEGLTSALGINIKTLAGWGTAIAAGKVALDVAKDAFFASESSVDEWGRTVAASQSLYEGFLTAINNGDISGYLSNIDSIVKAARLAYDELDKLGTMKTIQAPQISKQQTENERIRSMIQTGRYIAPQDGRRNAVFNGREMQTGDKLTAGQIRALEKQLQGGMQKMVKLVGNEVDQTGKAINAYYDKLAKTNGMSLQEFKKGTSSWEEFTKRMQGYEQYKEWDKQARTEFAKQGGRGNVDFDKSNPFAEFRKWGTFRVDKEGDNSYKDLVALIQQRDQQVGQVYSTQAQAYRTMNRAEGVTVRDIMGGKGGKGGSGGTATNPVDQAEKIVRDALFSYQQSVDKAKLEMESGLKTEADMKKTLLSGQERLYDAYGKAYATYADPKYKEAQDKAAAEIVKLGGEVKNATEAQKKDEQAARELEAAQKKLAEAAAKAVNAELNNDLKGFYQANKAIVANGGRPMQTPIDITYTDSNLQAFIDNLKERLSKADVGSDLYNALTKQLADANMLGNFISLAVKNGIDVAQIDPQALFSKIFGDGQNAGDFIPDDFWKGFVEQFKEKLGNGLNLNTNTGDVSERKDERDTNRLLKKNEETGKYEAKANELLSTMSGGIQNIAGGLEALGVKIPSELQSVLGGMQGISSILTGIAATVIAIEAIAGADALIPFAKGGIVHAAGGFKVPGNNFSGDLVPAALNSGELVLNKAQQGNLASQLEDIGHGSEDSQPFINGEMIYLGLQAYMRRSGLGEIVTAER